MKRKVYWKDSVWFFYTFKRTFSLHLNLDVVGKLGLGRLKGDYSNMHRTANQFIQQQRC